MNAKAKQQHRSYIPTKLCVQMY